MMKHPLFTPGFLSVWMAFFTLSCQGGPASQSKMTMTTNRDTIPPFTGKTDTAYLGTGCFWCTEAIFEQLEGVLSVTSGYAGDSKDRPSYELVSTGRTGFAECVEIVYDPARISFDGLLEVFWQVHDPTTLNRQGADVGPQYRSVVFYQTEEEKQKVEEYKAELDKSGAFPRAIVTTTEPFVAFFPAEDYHQEYYANNKNKNPYCQIVIRPKLEKFEKVFKDKLKKKS